jgi:hypothetical protein
MGNPDGNTPREDLGVNGTALKHILKKQNGVAQSGFIWLRIRISGGVL